MYIYTLLQYKIFYSAYTTGTDLNQVLKLQLLLVLSVQPKKIFVNRSLRKKKYGPLKEQ